MAVAELVWPCVQIEARPPAICNPTIDGNGRKGGRITSSKPAELKVLYNCLKPVRLQPLQPRAATAAAHSRSPQPKVFFTFSPQISKNLPRNDF